MKHFEVTESQGERTAWIYPELTGDYEPVHGEPEPGTLAVKLKHITPRGAEALQAKMISMGIMRKKVLRGGVIDVEVVKGRQADRDRLYAEAYVSDWQGFIKEGQPLAYSPDEMAALLANEIWLNKAIGKATEEMESFLSRNGHAS